MLHSRDGSKIGGRVIGASIDPDVALIEVEDELPVSLPWAETKSLKKREPLVVIGYPSPKNTFKMSTGRIVDFHPTGSREAALSNAPIAHGNSGGPGLRADASVAGLVTLMTLREKPEDSVAILFTADKVRPSVERFLEKPKDVLSSCGLGPDYVPEVPKDFDIDEAPATAAPVDVIPVATAVAKSKPKPLASVEPTPGKIAPTPLPKCPNGGPVLRVERISSTPETPGWWTVTVEGVITSYGSYDMTLQRLQVHVDGDPPVDAEVRVTPTTIGPGRGATWGRELSVYAPAGEPTEATANLEWTWGQGNYDWCETDAVTAVGPKPTPSPAPAAATPG
jgi:hypothetical protein